MQRKLASIQKITNIEPIPNADFIEKVTILGWNIVDRKEANHKVGDLCVYFEVDSYLPIREEFEFLRTSSYKNNELLGPGFRIKTQQLKGIYSQGLILPLSILPNGNYQEGDDVTEILQVQKFERPEVESGMGTVCGEFCPYISKTDEMRVQSIPEIIQVLKGKAYYISTKMDGTSCTIYNDESVKLCNRNAQIKESKDSAFWKIVYKLDLKEKLKDKKVILQGEVCGHGIQKNHLKLKELHFYIFNIFDLTTHKKYSLDEMIEFCNTYNLEMVPIDERGDSFDYTLEELLEKAKGLYPSGCKKEGIVVRALDNEYSPLLKKELSFKVLNNDFLLKD